jgi:hypothetical protein
MPTVQAIDNPPGREPKRGFPRTKRAAPDLPQKIAAKPPQIPERPQPRRALDPRSTAPYRLPFKVPYKNLSPTKLRVLVPDERLRPMLPPVNYTAPTFLRPKNLLGHNKKFLPLGRLGKVSPLCVEALP